VDFDSSPSFTPRSAASLSGLHAVAWYDDDNLPCQRLGLGPEYIHHTRLSHGPLGKGQVVLYAPKSPSVPTHATFKFLFNESSTAPQPPTTLK